MSATIEATATTSTWANPETVAEIYAAFGRGDVQTILDRLADDVSWDSDWADNTAQHSPIPHFTPRRGHAEVREFFQAVGSGTVHEFRVLDMMSSDQRVGAMVVIDLTLPNGGRLRDEELRLWTFGPHRKIVAMRHYIDTAKHLAAARGEDTTAR